METLEALGNTLDELIQDIFSLHFGNLSTVVRVEAVLDGLFNAVSPFDPQRPFSLIAAASNDLYLLMMHKKCSEIYRLTNNMKAEFRKVALRSALDGNLPTHQRLILESHLKRLRRLVSDFLAYKSIPISNQ